MVESNEMLIEVKLFIRAGQTVRDIGLQINQQPIVFLTSGKKRDRRDTACRTTVEINEKKTSETGERGTAKRKKKKITLSVPKQRSAMVRWRGGTTTRLQDQACQQPGMNINRLGLLTASSLFPRAEELQTLQGRMRERSRDDRRRRNARDSNPARERKTQRNVTQVNLRNTTYEVQLQSFSGWYCNGGVGM